MVHEKGQKGRWYIDGPARLEELGVKSVLPVTVMLAEAEDGLLLDTVHV